MREKKKDNMILRLGFDLNLTIYFMIIKYKHIVNKIIFNNYVHCIENS